MPVTNDEVAFALAEKNGSKSARTDGVHPRMLKHLPKSMIGVVCGLFQKSLDKCWIPLIEGREENLFESYRPVCLTSCFGKWLGRVLAKRMRWMLERMNVISPYQAGFRQNRVLRIS